MKESNYLTRYNHLYSEHRDLQATAMSVDWTGQWVLLAGRRHLALQKLDTEDEDCLKKFHRNSKYDVSAAEWAICGKSQEYCAIATSQLIEVVTWSSGDPTLIYSLRAHTRMVTDIDWHSKEPHLLASCSIDTFSHLWDLRDPRKPILSLSAVCMSGATQVGFNRVSGNLLATAHDGDLRIWDIRKGSCPMQYITAHLARIHGINWSHRHETHLTTASQDGTVKYFDINNSRRAEKIITISSPVWRARYTPIGNGLITVVVPHLGRGENSLLLWNNSKQSDPICSFEGHTDVILDFAWRSNRSHSETYMELITWSRDQTLRLWKIDEMLLSMCDSSQQNTEDEDINIGSWSMTNNDVYDSQQPSCSLQHEFSLLNTNIPHIEIETLDPVRRHAAFKISLNGRAILLQVDFPNDYPSPSIAPKFNFGKSCPIDDRLSTTLLKVLKSCALQRVKKGRTCIEQCLRALVAALKRSTIGGEKQFRLPSPRLEGALSGALHDACIPFPKTSGAKFNITGFLITFSQPLNTKRISLRRHSVTPRALSAISGGYLGNVMGSQPVLYAHRDTTTSTFYIQDRHRKNSNIRSLQRTRGNAFINIYDLTKALKINKSLAKNYVLHKQDTFQACKQNCTISKNYERPELEHAWILAAMIAKPKKIWTSGVSDLSYPNQLQKSMLNSLVTYFARNGDLQTAVMLCCTFDKSYTEVGATATTGYSSKSKKSPLSSPNKTIPPVTSSINLHIKYHRSNSWSDSLNMKEMKPLHVEIQRRALKRPQSQLFDCFKRAYADILYSLQLLSARSMILKNLYVPVFPMKCIEFAAECTTCNRINSSTVCLGCCTPLLYCTVCRIPVKGVINACLICGHGGHAHHLKKWFQHHKMCAIGCGCHCLQEYRFAI